MLLQVVFDTMKRHANNAELVLNACSALKNMSENADNRVAIIAQGGVAAFGDVKRNHLGNDEIQEIADSLLAALQLDVCSRFTASATPASPSKPAAAPTKRVLVPAAAPTKMVLVLTPNSIIRILFIWYSVL